MAYRVMDDYIQIQNRQGLWQDVARVIDLPKCRELSAKANAMEDTFEAHDAYMAKLVAIGEKIRKENENV